MVDCILRKQKVDCVIRVQKDILVLLLYGEVANLSEKHREGF
jgi:hypothetical protein